MDARGQLIRDVLEAMGELEYAVRQRIEEICHMRAI